MKKKSGSVELVSKVRLQIAAGAATPAPPLGSILGQRGVNIAGFCKEFNDRCKVDLKEYSGMKVTVIISVFSDRTFSFITKMPTTSSLIKKVLNIKSGSSEPGKSVVSYITSEQVKYVAAIKKVDSSAFDEAAIIKMVEGTVRSMGIKLKD